MAEVPAAPSSAFGWIYFHDKEDACSAPRTRLRYILKKQTSNCSSQIIIETTKPVVFSKPLWNGQGGSNQSCHIHAYRLLPFILCRDPQRLRGVVATRSFALAPPQIGGRRHFSRDTLLQQRPSFDNARCFFPYVQLSAAFLHW